MESKVEGYESDKDALEQMLQNWKGSNEFKKIHKITQNKANRHDQRNATWLEVAGDAQFKALVDKTVGGVMKSGEINKIYSKWFLSPVPPKGINLNVPMSDVFKHVVAKPTDSGDPNDYK